MHLKNSFFFCSDLLLSIALNRSTEKTREKKNYIKHCNIVPI